MPSEIARACQVWQSGNTDWKGLSTSFLFRLVPRSSRLPDALGSVKLFSLFLPRPPNVCPIGRLRRHVHLEHQMRLMILVLLGGFINHCMNMSGICELIVYRCNFGIPVACISQTSEMDTESRAIVR